MDLIAQHPYIKTERKITSTKKYEVEHDRWIYLYRDKVVTQNREFPIDDVMDLSFREIKAQGGILYLHTNQGVFAYIVKSAPSSFIAAYKKHFK